MAATVAAGEDTMTTTETTTTASAVTDVLDRCYAAWAANDADAFAAEYLPDATVALAGSFANGREAVRSYMAAGFAGPLAGSRGTDEVVQVRFVGDATAIVNSESGVLFAGETTVPDERLRRSTWVLAQSADGWKVAAYHNCAK